jgi:hypothetical protein
MAEQQEPRSPSQAISLRLTSPTKPATGYLLRSITIGKKSLSTKMHTKTIKKKQPNGTKAFIEVETDKPEIPLYIVFDRQKKEFNIVDENDVLQPPGNHLAIPTAGLRWAVHSTWSPRVALIPSDGSSYITVELDDIKTAEAFAQEIGVETEVELDLTSK